MRVRISPPPPMFDKQVIINRGCCTQDEMNEIAESKDYIRVWYKDDAVSENFWGFLLEDENTLSTKSLHRFLICNNILCLGGRGLGRVGLALSDHTGYTFLLEETIDMLKAYDRKGRTNELRRLPKAKKRSGSIRH
jgi:hypothetical protein